MAIADIEEKTKPYLEIKESVNNAAETSALKEEIESSILNSTV